MAEKKLDGADYLLLLLYIGNKKPIKGAVRLMKMIFLFTQEVVPMLKKQELYATNLAVFFPYDYGPFSKSVYSDVELFESLNFITTDVLNASGDFDDLDNRSEEIFHDGFGVKEDYLTQPDGRLYVYTIAQKGVEFVETEIIGKSLISEAQLFILEQFKEKMVSLSLEQILYYTYTKYPEYTEKSQIKEEILGHVF
jgi:hypothetical protein